MIKLKIYTEENDLLIEEVLENVYDFDFDFFVDNLIIKYLDGEESKIKLIPIKNIKRLVGYEIN
jgi:hypothetical protein